MSCTHHQDCLDCQIDETAEILAAKKEAFARATRLTCVYCLDTYRWGPARMEILTGIWSHPPKEGVGHGYPCLAAVIHKFMESGDP